MKERKTFGQRLDKFISNISNGFHNFGSGFVKTTMGVKSNEYIGDDKKKITPEMIRIRINAIISLFSGIFMAAFAYGYIRAKVLTYIYTEATVLPNGYVEPPPALWGWFYTIMWGFFMLISSICILSGICVILRITVLYKLNKRDEIATTGAAIMLCSYIVTGLIIYIFRIPVWVNM